MRKLNSDWSEWGEFLRSRRLDGIVTWLLDAGSPLTLLGSQLLYMGEPFLGSDRVRALARLLEDNDQSQAFASYLHKDVH
jgi:hypothetical protein